MSGKFRHDIVHRWEGNPVIALDDLTFTTNNIYSAAAVKKNGEYILLVTMEDLEGKTSIHLAKSEDGYHFDVEETSFMTSSTDDSFRAFETMGVREARITFMEERYYIVYLGVGHHGFVLCLAVTDDFRTVKRLGVISEPETKAGALFASKINGKYARLERPKAGDRIWMSYSNDLLTWGESDVVISPRSGFWDSDLIGCAFTPIEIEEGWLLGYYGIKNTSSGPITRLGAAILDRENPCKVIARSNIPIISPRKDYERIGDMTNVVMSSGAILEEDILKIYYAAADNCLCLGTTKLADIVKTCIESTKEF
ncbi:MAG: glycoside hydrolase family 130 protein [Sedimentisphaerales bacterium]|nr:glycoside hydrolase family 130 protein [Sedimentisphaerales bacterium]